MSPEVLRIAAFAADGRGGNPAGVVIADKHPDEDDMRRIAAEVGYSETAFAMPAGDAWRVRYFAPESEVPFCGHATIALGAALAEKYGEGRFALVLNDAEISVESWREGGDLLTALQSPPTRSNRLSAALRAELLALFGYSEADLDERIPPARIHAGADHMCLCLNSRKALAAMHYDLARGRDFMRREGLITVLLAWVETPRRFHTRNPFASGGVYEDPATGAATAAFAAYLRDLGWPHDGEIEILQGEDMGAPSRLLAGIPPEAGSSIRVAGRTRPIEE
jgi:PhzF family phenazine biosynthesis protein